MNSDVEQLRTVLDRLVAVRVGPDGAQLEQDEGHIMMCLGTLQFLATDLRETRIKAVRVVR
jgi:hypothetical protein